MMNSSFTRFFLIVNFESHAIHIITVKNMEKMLRLESSTVIQFFHTYILLTHDFLRHFFFTANDFTKKFDFLLYLSYKFCKIYYNRGFVNECSTAVHKMCYLPSTEYL